MRHARQILREKKNALLCIASVVPFYKLTSSWGGGDRETRTWRQSIVSTAHGRGDRASSPKDHLCAGDIRL